MKVFGRAALLLDCADDVADPLPGAPCGHYVVAPSGHL